MNIQDIFNEIESERFTTLLGLVSTPRALDEALIAQPVVKELMRQIRSQGEEKQVTSRLTRLLDERSDPRYAHDKDLPIAIYLRVLDICSPIGAFSIAERALELPNLWWGRAMAMRIAAQPNRKVQSGNLYISELVTLLSTTNVVSDLAPPIEIASKPYRRLVVSHTINTSAKSPPSGQIGKQRIRVRSNSVETAL